MKKNMKNEEYYRLHKELLEAVIDAQYRTSYIFAFDYSNMCTNVYYYPTDKEGRPIIEKRISVINTYTRIRFDKEGIIRAIEVIKGINDIE